MGGRPDGLRIRRAEPSDYAGFAGTMTTPRAVAGTLQLPMPSLDAWRERMTTPDPASFVIVAEVPQSSGGVESFEIVGHLGLFTAGSTSPRRGHAMSIGMSVRDEWQGRGVGSALMEVAIERADRWMSVLRLELTVFVDNAAAIALYRRHGFVVEGTHRAYALRDGAFADAHTMARLHPHPPALPSVAPEATS